MTEERRQRRLLGALFAATATAIAALAVTVATSAAPTAASDPILTRSRFVASADAFVARGTPLPKSSSSRSLRVGGGSRAAAFLQFSVQGLPGVVTQAMLDLYVLSPSRTRARVTVAYGPGRVEGPSATVPAPVASAGSAWASVSSIGWVSIDVTRFVRGNGPVTLELTSPGLRKAIAKVERDWNLWLDVARASEGRAQLDAVAQATKLNPLSPEIAQLRKELGELGTIEVGG